ncbi:hypothetical protein PGH12_11440 [Chryseobacterium wangxinyae]|uniref:hypothetical protein n=1 Tax=Chryseobacterium sp. CY350 TaxID=2997336 RepID=UPI002270C824|nr:hypothetical protein [Chryseobacterium sp. CY350]MCY0976316.1 hypothetical protein [Chryseobacterium sp. CY350]WBZ94086.1 hypothetical protein PGH12_11440 [Chryseobacterium sp. CY350]
MKNGFLFILLVPLLINCQTEKSAASNYQSHVEDIVFDEKKDDPNFKRCDGNDLGIQYYSGPSSASIQYRGEKIAIIKNLEKLKIGSSNSENGYITVRFLVNCEGRSGYFRVQEMDEKYKVIKYDKTFSDQLLSFTKNLGGWIPMKINGKNRDYYQYLTYKIENGKVSEILP